MRPEVKRRSSAGGDSVMASCGCEWEKMVCEALGVDPGLVKTLRVDSSPDELLTVTLQLVPNTEVLEDCAAALMDHVEQINMEHESGTVTVTLERELESEGDE